MIKIEKFFTDRLPRPMATPGSVHPRDPSFIGIGMASSGTRWLHDQLAHHSDVWVPYRKELHFFDRGMRYESARRQMNAFVHYCGTRYKTPNLFRNLTARIGLHPYDDTQIRFLTEYILGRATPRLAQIERETAPRWNDPGGLKSLIDNPGLGDPEYEHYRRLFGYHAKPVCGEITPAYSYLSETFITEISARFPDTKFVLIVRNPVERHMSSWLKRIRKGKRELPAMEEPSQQNDPSDSARSTVTGDPCEIEDRWCSVLGRERLLTIRFPDIVDRPEHVREQIVEFLALRRGTRGFKVQPDFNRKHQRVAANKLPPADVEAMRARVAARLQDAEQRYLDRFEAQ